MTVYAADRPRSPRRGDTLNRPLLTITLLRAGAGRRSASGSPTTPGGARVGPAFELRGAPTASAPASVERTASAAC